jgi:hypothetical protein
MIYSNNPIIHSDQVHVLRRPLFVASAARAFISPTAFERARGGAQGAGGGRVEFAGGGGPPL